jgi:hypothetical protein
MKNESLLQALSARARSESPPAVDVADRVIARLSASAVPGTPYGGRLTAEQNLIERMAEKPLLWLAAASSAVAVPAAVTAIMVYNAATGPLYEISQAISWVAQ